MHDERNRERAAILARVKRVAADFHEVFERVADLAEQDDDLADVLSRAEDIATELADFHQDLAERWR